MKYRFFNRLLRAGLVLAVFVGSAATASAQGVPSEWSETGIASYYGQTHQGRRMAGGGTFDSKALTAAHPSLPFGTRVRVIAAATGREVMVTITDRLPSARRIIDLSLSAARQLGIVHMGTAEVTLFKG